MTEMDKENVFQMIDDIKEVFYSVVFIHQNLTVDAALLSATQLVIQDRNEQINAELSGGQH